MKRREPERVPVQRSSSASCAVALLVEVVGDPRHRAPVPACLSYDISDPYAVVLDIHAGGEAPVTWLFARDLLLTGIHRPSGHGNVAVVPGAGPCAGHVFISLRGADAAAVLRASAADVRFFLQQTEVVVPAGAEEERLDIDALVRGILGS
ncbi:sporulation-specific cell division protein SsgB [Kitasatospora phosalacinea]|uniref:Sporulation-specific cell division protein SsgB n=1 Tax=Kitasatospora phosalacinea TaxID=2065 RepID=A0A9W6QDX5_9ACTN|nr:SsgA family sporulation/cell division regulator [Kitasatospora phosalacinea]GLW72762.1 sporulation-specific cell division protein SsgB [Kitasatospora phosalacinea]